MRPLAPDRPILAATQDAEDVPSEPLAARPAEGEPSSAGPRVARIRPEIQSIPVTPGKDIRFRRLSLAEGLSQTRVAQILQDDQGFMWFGTQHGLNRFDGQEFRVFTHDAARPDSLSGVFVYALFKDRRGTIWVASDQGLDAYRSETETFRHFELDARDPMVIHISESSDGMLWLATGQGLYRLDPDTAAVTRFAHDPTDAWSLPSDDIKSTGEDRAGRFWVASSEGLDAFDAAEGRVTLHIPLRESVREFSFHEDSRGVFWIIYGSGNGLASFDRGSNELTRYRFGDREMVDTSLTGVYAILEARDGTVWLGTMGAGLLKYDRAQHRFLSYRNQPGNPESLAENRVIALYEDSEGNVWTGLHASPPNSFPSIAPPFESLRVAATRVNSLGESLVNAISTDSHGDVWFGAGGALNRLDRETGEYEPIEPLGRGTPIEVLTVLEDAAGTLWVGSLGTGLQRLDRATGRFESLRHDPNDGTSISSDIVTRLLVDRAGTLWAATWNGLNRFDAATGRFTVHKRDPGASAEAYFSIAEDHDGILWLGSTTGLYRFDPDRGGRFTAYTHDPENPSSLSNNTVNSVAVDRSGAVWVSTQNGLNLFDPLSGTFKAYYKKDGLPGNAVSCLLDDGQGNLWMSTNNGVSRMNIAARRFDNYSTADGLPGNDLTGWNACHKSASGEMFFGGFAGAAAIRPERLTGSAYAPPVVLTGLRLAGEPVEPWQPPLGRSITHADRLVLTARQNDFTLGFAALSFTSPATNRYRYRLTGLDTAWHELGGGRRAVSYTTLPSGSYRFEVQAAVSRGPWTTPGAVLDIVVTPPWWGTWWFRGAYVAAFGLLLFAGYRYRLRQIAYQYHIRLDERVNERTRIARELHDSLLQGFQGLMFRLQAVRDLLPDHPDRAVAQLDVALERADQAIVEGRDAVHDLRAPALTDTDLAQALTSLADELASSTSARPPVLRVLVEGHPRVLDAATRDGSYQVAREALRNAFHHAGAARVECELGYGEREFRVRVRDDGRGIDPDVLEAGIKAGRWGLPGMRERAEQLGGRLTVWSARNAGTELQLSIPARIAYGG